MTQIKTNKLFSSVKQILDTNAPTIATFGSVIGLGLTIYFMHRAAKQAAIVEEKFDDEIQALEDEADEMTLPDGTKPDQIVQELKTEKARIKMNKYLSLIWIYRWALVSGFASGGLSFLSNYLNGRTIATVTGLLALESDKLKVCGEKVKEMIGEDKFKQLRDEVNNELFAEQVRSGNTKVETPKTVLGKDLDIPDGYESYYVPDFGQRLDLPAGLLDEAIDRAKGIFKDKNDKSAYLDYNGFLNFLRIPSCRAFDSFRWTAENPFKARVGYVNMGEYGMKAIIFDNLPGVEHSFTK